MIYFLYGTDSYRIREKEQELVTQFLAGDESGINLEKVDGAEMSLAQFEQVVSAVSFFAGDKVVVIKNLLMQNKDSELKGKIAEKLSVILKEGASDRLKNLKGDLDSSLRPKGPPSGLRMTEKSSSVTMIFVEYGEPDKREKLYKALSKTENIFVFGPLSDYELSQWINNMVKKHNFKIDRSAAEALAVAVGANLWRLKNEIDKLTLYAKSQKRDQIEISDIKKMVESVFNPNVFQFIEAIATGNKKSSVKLLQQFINNGENENYLLSMIIYQFRTLTIIKDLLDRGRSNSAIASEARINPYVVQKSLPVLKKYSLKNLINYYQKLYEYDVKIKIGQLDAKVAVDLLVAG
jgi:DNA polymerase III delta subunit